MIRIRFSFDLVQPKVFESIVLCSEFGYILNLYALFNASYLLLKQIFTRRLYHYGFEMSSNYQPFRADGNSSPTYRGRSLLAEWG